MSAVVIQVIRYDRHQRAHLCSVQAMFQLRREEGKVFIYFPNDLGEGFVIIIISAGGMIISSALLWSVGIEQLREKYLLPPLCVHSFGGAYCAFIVCSA